MIDAIYTTHTCRNSGWDIDEIFEGTIFKLSAPTWRIPKDKPFQMLDWDFRQIEKRGLDQTWLRHSNIALKHDLEVVMTPDLWFNNWGWAYDRYCELKSICNRVVMPVHIPPQDYDIEVAWPMGVWTKDSVAVWDVSDKVTHLLGGSPHAQLEMSNYFPNLQSVDGNQIFFIAIRFGKYWKKGRWINSDPPVSREECFRRSVTNISDAWVK